MHRICHITSGFNRNHGHMLSDIGYEKQYNDVACEEAEAVNQGAD